MRKQEELHGFRIPSLSKDRGALVINFFFLFLGVMYGV